MNIRNGNSSYEDIISYLENKKIEMEDAMTSSTLPEKIDIEKIKLYVIYHILLHKN